MPVIPTLARQSQEHDHRFQGSLQYKMRPCLKKSAMVASKILKQQYQVKHFVSLFKSSNGIFGNEVLSSASGLNNCCRKEKAKETATDRTDLGNKHWGHENFLNFYYGDFLESNLYIYVNIYIIGAKLISFPSISMFCSWACSFVLRKEIISLD